MAGKTILLCDDIFSVKNEGQKRSRALQGVAKALSEKLRAPLRTITVLDIPKKLIGSKDSSNSKSAVETLYGRPVDVILKEAKKSDVEMVVLGTRGIAGLKRLFLGSVSEEVVRNATVPVMVIGAQAVEDGFTWGKKKKMRILVISDLDSSGSAERYAAKLATRLQAEILLYHSVGDPIRHMKDMLYSQRVTNSGIDRIFEEMKDFAEVSVGRKLKAYQGQGLAVSAHISYEEQDLTKTLKKNDWMNADLIVMGSHSRSRVVKAILGSTVRKVILGANRPVIIVRS